MFILMDEMLYDIVYFVTS